MAYPPTTPDVSAPVTDSESYEKWYGRQVIALCCLMGTVVTAGALHFAAKIHQGGVEMLALLGRAMPGWEAAKTVESVTAYLVFFLFLAMGVAFFRLPLIRPQRLPAGVSAARFRTAEIRVRYGVVGGDPETDHLARTVSEIAAHRNVQAPKAMLPLQIICSGSLLLICGAGLVRGIVTGETWLVLIEAGVLSLFACMYAMMWRTVLLRRKALEFLRLHEALYRGAAR